jgi:hypothetical protein
VSDLSGSRVGDEKLKEEEERKNSAYLHNVTVWCWVLAGGGEASQILAFGN